MMWLIVVLSVVKMIMVDFDGDDYNGDKKVEMKK